MNTFQRIKKSGHLNHLMLWPLTFSCSCVQLTFICLAVSIVCSVLPTFQLLFLFSCWSNAAVCFSVCQSNSASSVHHLLCVFFFPSLHSQSVYKLKNVASSFLDGHFLPWTRESLWQCRQTTESGRVTLICMQIIDDRSEESSCCCCCWCSTWCADYDSWSFPTTYHLLPGQLLERQLCRWCQWQQQDAASLSVACQLSSLSSFYDWSFS